MTQYFFYSVTVIFLSIKKLLDAIIIMILVLIKLKRLVYLLPQINNNFTINL